MTGLLRQHSFICISLLITCVIYTQGLPGDFIFDDRHNIVDNTRLHIDELRVDALVDASFSSNSGILKRPISMLSFALNHLFSGLDPVAMKLTNIVLHLVTGILVYVFVYQIVSVLRQSGNSEGPAYDFLPWLVATLWLLSPYQISSVLYVVQRMTVLSALFSVLGLVVWIWSRTQWWAGRKKTALSLVCLALGACFPLALLSKENGLLMVPMIVLLEISILSRVYKYSFIDRNRPIILSMIVITTIISIWGLAHWEFIYRGYASRPFTLDERVITQARIFMIYILDLVLPAVERLHFFHDEISVSETLLKPITGLLSVFGIASLLLIALYFIDRHPLISFGVLFFICGHLMESTVIPLELFYEHRNYLPSVGLFLSLIVALIVLTEKRRYFLYSTVFILLILNTGNSLLRANDWSSLVSFYEHEYRVNPHSPRSNHNVAELYSAIIRQYPEKQEELYGFAQERYLYSHYLDETYISGLIGLLRASHEFKQAIDPGWIEKISHSLLHHRFNHHSRQNVRHLVNCFESHICSEPQWFSNLLDELIKQQEEKHGYASANLYWLAAKFYFSQFEDKKSYQLLMRAAEASDSKRYILEATRVAMDAGKFELARKNLLSVESSELSYQEREYLSSLKGKLEKLLSKKGI